MTVDDSATGHDAPFDAPGGGGAVDSVNGQTGVVALTAGDVAALPLPSGATVDTTTYDNPYGEPGEKMPVVVFAADGPALAFAIEGDAYPRLLFMSDPADAVFYFGDGTEDPTGGGSVNTDSGNLNLSANTGGAVRLAGTRAEVNGGPVQAYLGATLQSPDGTHYRIDVANDGTLSTTAVA